MMEHPDVPNIKGVLVPPRAEPRGYCSTPTLSISRALWHPKVLQLDNVVDFVNLLHDLLESSQARPNLIVLFQGTSELADALLETLSVEESSLQTSCQCSWTSAFIRACLTIAPSVLPEPTTLFLLLSVSAA